MQLDGATQTQPSVQPLIGYRMYGVPCANCGLPLTVLWVFKHGLEGWHEGTESRCQLSFQPPTVHNVETPPEKKPDKRKVPRRYVHCKRCDIRFAQPRYTVGDERQELCKSCRNQQELFSDDEITELTHGIASHIE